MGIDFHDLPKELQQRLKETHPDLQPGKNKKTAGTRQRPAGTGPAKRTNNREPKWECNECGQKFTTITSAERHATQNRHTRINLLLT